MYRSKTDLTEPVETAASKGAVFDDRVNGLSRRLSKTAPVWMGHLWACPDS